MSSPEPVPPERRFVAFISYRHLDNAQEGRRWAEWLHHGLENYNIPSSLRGKSGKTGLIPRALYPIFRDEEEMATSRPLGELVEDGLQRSDWLIVLCSPRSAASIWVNGEVDRFIEMKKGDRILPVILEGEPDAVFRKSKGESVDSMLECLPLSLRDQQDDLPPSNDRTTAAERLKRLDQKLAADFRVPGSSEQGYTSAAAYRNYLENLNEKAAPADRLPRATLRILEGRYAQRLRRMQIQIIAGILGLDVGELSKRDEAARASRFRKLAGLFGSIALVAVVAAVYGLWQRDQAVTAQKVAEIQRDLAQTAEGRAVTAQKDAETQRDVARIAEDKAVKGERRANAEASQSAFLRGGQLLLDSDTDNGSQTLARSIELNPGNRPAAIRLINLLGQRQWPMHLAALPHAFPLEYLEVSHEAGRFYTATSLGASQDSLNSLQTWDSDTLKLVQLEFNGTSEGYYELLLSGDGLRLLAVTGYKRPGSWTLLNAKTGSKIASGSGFGPLSFFSFTSDSRFFLFTAESDNQSDTGGDQTSFQLQVLQAFDGTPAKPGFLPLPQNVNVLDADFDGEDVLILADNGRVSRRKRNGNAPWKSITLGSYSDGSSELPEEPVDPEDSATDKRTFTRGWIYPEGNMAITLSVEGEYSETETRGMFKLWDLKTGGTLAEQSSDVIDSPDLWHEQGLPTKERWRFSCSKQTMEVVLPPEEKGSAHQRWKIHLSGNASPTFEWDSNQNGAVTTMQHRLSGQLTGTVRHESDITLIRQLSPTRVVTASSDNEARVWELIPSAFDNGSASHHATPLNNDLSLQTAKGKLSISLMDSQDGPGEYVITHPDGRKLKITRSNEVAWDHEGSLVAISSDGSLGALSGYRGTSSGGADYGFHLFRTQDGQVYSPLLRDYAGGGGAVFSPDNRFLFTCNGTQIFRWDLSNWVRSGPLLYHQGVKTLAIDKTGKRLVSWGSDGVMWNLETNTAVGTFRLPIITSEETDEEWQSMPGREPFFTHDGSCFYVPTSRGYVLFDTTSLQALSDTISVPLGKAGEMHLEQLRSLSGALLKNGNHTRAVITLPRDLNEKEVQILSALAELTARNDWWKPVGKEKLSALQKSLSDTEIFPTINQLLQHFIQHPEVPTVKDSIESFEPISMAAIWNLYGQVLERSLNVNDEMDNRTVVTRFNDVLARGSSHDKRAAAEVVDAWKDMLWKNIQMHTIQQIDAATSDMSYEGDFEMGRALSRLRTQSADGPLIMAWAGKAHLQALAARKSKAPSVDGDEKTTSINNDSPEDARNALLDAILDPPAEEDPEQEIRRWTDLVEDALKTARALNFQSPLSGWELKMALATGNHPTSLEALKTGTNDTAPFRATLLAAEEKPQEAITVLDQLPANSTDLNAAALHAFLLSSTPRRAEALPLLRKLRPRTLTADEELLLCDLEAEAGNLEVALALMSRQIEDHIPCVARKTALLSLLERKLPMPEIEGVYQLLEDFNDPLPDVLQGALAKWMKANKPR